MKIVGVWSSALTLMVALAASPLRSQSLEPPTNTQKAYPLPEGWKVYPIPTSCSQDWIRANHSNREWRVQVSNGKVLIEKIVPGRPVQGDPKHDLPFETKPQEGWVYTTAPPPPPPRPANASEIDQKVPMRAHRSLSKKQGWYRVRDRMFGGARISVKTPDGWIVGFDAGEWGGGLYWFSPDGTRHYQIKLDRPVDWCDSENVRDLMTYKDSVIAFQGLAHLSMDRGKVVTVSRQKNGKWKAALLTKLGSEPQVCIQDGVDSWIIVTDESLLRLNADGNLENLGKIEFASGLYPNSIARDAEGVIYLGMRHFVARLIPDGKGFRAELLAPTNLPLFDPEPPGTAD